MKEPGALSAGLATPTRRHATATALDWQRNAVLVLCVIFSIVYLACAIQRAAIQPLWMDEVLSTWDARMPSAGLVINAIYHGSEFAPPVYNLMLHYLIGVFGDSYLVLRLPAIMATLCSGIGLFLLLRKPFGLPAAAAGMVLFLLGTSSGFAIQVRPYACVTLCFALAALIWRNLEGNKPGFGRLAILACLLALAGSLHFYGALFIPCFGLVELCHTAQYRRIRWRVWGALVIAGLCCIAWLPLIMIIHEINQMDVIGVSYYARPTMDRLVLCYFSLTLSSYALTGLVMVSSVSRLIPRMFDGGRVLIFSEPNSSADERARTTALLICTALLPLIIFFMAATVIKTFNTRYCLAASLGTYGLAAVLLSKSRYSAAVFPILVLGLFLVPTIFSAQRLKRLTPPLAIAQQAGRPWPIVIAGGLEYLELVEAAPPELRQRFVFLDTPPGALVTDPTNQHEVDRWNTLRGDLDVQQAEDFIRTHPRFYVLQGNTTDDISPWLYRRHYVDRDIVTTYAARLSEAHGETPPEAGLREKGQE